MSLIFYIHTTLQQSFTTGFTISMFNILTATCFCRGDVSKLKFEGKTFYVIGVQKEVSIVPVHFENI